MKDWYPEVLKLRALNTELKAVVAEMGEDTRLGNQEIGYGTVVVSNYLERFEEILEGASDDKR